MEYDRLYLEWISDDSGINKYIIVLYPNIAKEAV